MIYSVYPDRYPAVEQLQTETVFNDLNDQPWKVAVTTSSTMYIRYEGEPYFQDATFCFKAGNGERLSINNTGCLMMLEGDFKNYYRIREIIKGNYTDDIWEEFETLFSKRFLQDLAMMESEVIENIPNQKWGTDNTYPDGAARLFSKLSPDETREYNEKICTTYWLDTGGKIPEPGPDGRITDEMMIAAGFTKMDMEEVDQHAALEWKTIVESAERAPWWKRFRNRFTEGIDVLRSAFNKL